MKRSDSHGEEAEVTYSGPERRTPDSHIALTDEQVERIAEKAAEKAVGKFTDHVYQQVGKGVINKLIWLVGATSVGVYLWAQSHGWIK